MNPHGYAAGQAGVLQIITDTQLIFCMTALMNHEIHGIRHIILFVIGCDTHIFIIKFQCKRMLCLANGTMASVQFHHFHQIVRKLSLNLRRIMQMQKTVINLRFLTDGMNKGYQTLSDCLKKCIQKGHIRTAFIFIQQCIIRLFAAVIIPRKLSVIGNQFLQYRSKKRKITGLLCPVPHITGLIGQHGVIHIFIRRNSGQTVIASL